MPGWIAQSGTLFFISFYSCVDSNYERKSFLRLIAGFHKSIFDAIPNAFFQKFRGRGVSFPADSCSLKRIPFSGKSILVHPRVQWKNPLQRHLSRYIRDFISGIRNRENEASFPSRVSTGVRTRTLLMHDRDTVGMCSRMWCFGQLQSSKIGRKRNSSPSRQPCIGFSHKKVCAKAWN